MLWINVDKEELEPIRKKYAVKHDVLPFILTFDIGMPVFGEELSFKTADHLAFGSDVVPKLQDQFREDQELYGKMNMG